MSILATLPTGKWLLPTEMLLKWIPAACDPLTALTHGATLVYFPSVLRIFLFTPGGYNNEDPRAQLQKYLTQDGVFSRLHGAHMNGLESFPFFAAAVLAGLHCKVDRVRISKMATLWLIIRSFYIPMYIFQNKATSGLRSLAFLWSLCLSMNLLREAAALWKRDQ